MQTICVLIKIGTEWGFAYDGTQKDLSQAKHGKHEHLREENQNTGSTMIR